MDGVGVVTRTLAFSEVTGAAHLRLGAEGPRDPGPIGPVDPSQGGLRRSGARGATCPATPLPTTPRTEKEECALIPSAPASTGDLKVAATESHIALCRLSSTQRLRALAAVDGELNATCTSSLRSRLWMRFTLRPERFATFGLPGARNAPAAITGHIGTGVDQGVRLPSAGSAGASPCFERGPRTVTGRSCASRDKQGGGSGSG